jgi:uncharacterized membrane protein YoaK (UPF0700 family)
MRRSNVRKTRLAVSLAAVAGFLDVVGYLTLRHLFTAHMTGNTSKLGVALGHGDLAKAAPLALAPFLFAAGIAAGTVLADVGAQWAALALQSLLVAAFMSSYGSAPFYGLEAMATVALGLQTAALTSVGGETVRTSYISGVLTNLTQTLVRRATRRRARRDAALLATLLVAYLAGATLGSYALARIAIWCLSIPLAALLAAAASEHAADAGPEREAERGGGEA